MWKLKVIKINIPDPPRYKLKNGGAVDTVITDLLTKMLKYDP